jgi:uncharacterized protein YndB with AHSA1/START domain
MVEKSKNNLKVDPERREISMSRLFDAPRELVYRVMLDPKLVPQWWGPRRLTTQVEQMDVRPGGQWRFVQQDADGNVFAFHGEYREVSPERTVSTFEFEGLPPGHAVLETVTLEEQDGRTLMTVTDTYQSLDDLQGMLQSGMESGASESYDRLEELLKLVEDHS